MLAAGVASDRLSWRGLAAVFWSQDSPQRVTHRGRVHDSLATTTRLRGHVRRRHVERPADGPLDGTAVARAFTPR
jgi:hypothetical protein